MAVNTELSVIGVFSQGRDKLSTFVLGSKEIKEDDTASLVLKIGGGIAILTLVCIGGFITKPYIDFMTDDFSSNINSHDLHVFSQTVLESNDTHGGRSPIAIVLSVVLLFVLYSGVLASDWLFKFELSVNTAAFTVFNLFHFVLMIFALSHYEGKKFVESNENKSKSNGFEYKHIDSLNHPSLSIVSNKILELQSDKNDLKTEKEKAQEHKSIWVKRQGIKERIILHGRVGLQRLVNSFQHEIDSINTEISKVNTYIVKKEGSKANQVTDLHWKDLVSENEFNSGLKNREIIGGVMAFPYELAMLGYMKLFLGLIRKRKHKSRTRTKKLPEKETLSLKARFENIKGSISKISLLKK